MKHLIYISIIAVFFFSCIGKVDERGDASIISNEENIIEQASLLRVAVRDGYRIMEVVNAWDTTKLLRRYILVQHGKKLPNKLPVGEVVRVPVNRIVAYTSVDIGSLAAIDEVDKVVGVCEAKYIQYHKVKRGLKDGVIKDLGSYVSPNIELMLSTRADVVIASPYEGKNHGVVEELKIPIAECASYLEKSPLGRSEWIKFYGELTAKTVMADSIYNDTKRRYNTTVRMIKDKVKSSPKILPEKRYGQVWFVAGGKSYMAQILKDAGGNFPWKDSDSSTAIPLSFEEVYQKAYDADVWFFGYCKPNGSLTLNEFKKEYESYSTFEAFKKGNVYGCNTELVPLYEESPLRPDLLLLDFAKMLHPTLFSSHDFVYYKKLERGE